MDRQPIKRKPKTRKKKWDSPDADEEVDFEEKDEGVVQNGEEKEPEVAAHQNRKDETGGKEQNKTSTQKDYDALDHTDLTLGGVKRHHESTDFEKEPPPVDNMHISSEERQMVIASPSNAGWIQVKPKKGKKGRIET